MSGMRALAAFILLALMIAPAQAQERMSIADCLLRSGYSTQVTARGAAAVLARLAGVNAWDGGAVLADATMVATVDIETDTGPRMVRFSEGGGELYAFVYKHPDDPGRRLDGEPAWVWHGDCFIRVQSDG